MVRVIDMPTPGKRSLLERSIFNGIVFHMSWEDPEMDRRAFNLTSDHTVISITSAGCNPLNFLCQNPKRLIAVDGNPAQNAVMELKLATIRTCDHDTFFDIFAARQPRRVLEVYRPRLRALLSERSQQFWDRNLWKAAQGIYGHGRIGLFCRILRQYLKLCQINPDVLEDFFECRTLDEQQAYYHRHIAPKLWGTPSKMLCAFKPFIYLAGVHPKQFQLIDGRHDMYQYVKERIDYALTQVPVYDNYFLSQAVSGRFRGHRVPPYLLPENYETLRNNLDKVEVVNGWLGPYLDTQPAGSIDRFNLLDIFDWMPAPIFEQTMRSVLRAASPEAIMIYRSGSYQLDPPEALKPYLQHHPELSKQLLAIDRSMTYGSFHVYSVQSGHNGDGVSLEIESADGIDTLRVNGNGKSRRNGKRRRNGKAARNGKNGRLIGVGQAGLDGDLTGNEHRASVGRRRRARELRQGAMRRLRKLKTALKA